MTISQVESTPPELSKWNQAIREAKAKVKALQYSIRVFKELRDAGEQWPETKEKPTM